MANGTNYLSGTVQNHYTAYRDRADPADNKLAGGHGDSWGNRQFLERKIGWLIGGYDDEIDITDEKYAGNKLMNEQGQYYTYGDNPIFSKDSDGYWNTIEDQARKKAEQPEKPVEATPEQKAEAQRNAEALAASQQQAQAEQAKSDSQKNQSVQNAFNGSNNQIDPGVNKNREEAVERVQEYQKTNTNKAVNNTEKSSTSSTTSSNGSGYVQQLADNAMSDYTEKWRNNQGSTTNYSNIFTNNIKQDVGNSGNWSTNFGNNAKLNNVRAGNDYSLNLGNINLNNN